MNNTCCHCGDKIDPSLEAECVECYINGLITYMGVTEESEIQKVI